MSLTLIVARPEGFAARVVAPLPRRPAVDVAVPVDSGDADIAANVRRLHGFLHDRFPFSARITIAENRGSGATTDIADALAAELSDVRALHVNQIGRGRALAAAWMTSEARVVACVDARLSTHVAPLLPLVAPILSGHAEMVVGRLMGPERELRSRAYNLLLRVACGIPFWDAQCGFKAVRADIARRLVPQVVDRGRLFDTELLVRARRAAVRIHEIPLVAHSHGQSVGRRPVLRPDKARTI